LPAQEDLEAQVKEAIKAYSEHKRETYLEVYAKVSKLGADALPILLKVASEENTSEGLVAKKVAEAIVHTASAQGVKERQLVEQKLVDALKLELPVNVKRFAIELLGYCGMERAADALGELLSDEALREDARRALERIPTENASRVILKALPNAKGIFKVGLINTLGKKRYVEAVDALADALKDDDEAVRIAAIEALGRIPDKRCEPILKTAITQAKNERQRHIALDAYLRLADGLAEVGEKKLSGEMAFWVYKESGDLSAMRAALISLAKALGVDAVKTLIDALRNDDEQIRRIALSLLLDLRGPEVTQALCEELKRAEGNTRLLIVELLGKRSDRVATESLLELLKVEDEALQVAVVRALSSLNDERAIKPLVQLCLRGGGVAEAASQALSSITEGDVSGAIIEALPNAPDEAKVHLLRALGYHKTDKSTQVLIEAAKDTREAIAVAALQALSIQRPVEAIALLEELSQKGTDAVKRSALQAYLRVADSIRTQDEAKALEMYHRAAQLAIHDDERRMVLSGITAIGDPKSLPIVEELQKNPALAQECAEAYAAIADKLASKRAPEADVISLYKRALLLSRERRLIEDIADKMRSFGVSTGDIASERGYVTRWWFLGPIKGRDEWRNADAIEVGKRIDVSKPVKLEQGVLRWRYGRVDDPTGHVNLKQIVSRQDFMCAYMMTEFDLDEPTEAVMLIGSDDDVFVWLNGELVHKFIGDRGWRADQDTVNVKLNAGTNTLLLKVLNGRAQWAASVRFLTPDGKPIDIDKRIATKMADALSKMGFIVKWHLIGPFSGQDVLREKDVIAPDAVDISAQVVAEGRSFRWIPHRLESPNGVIDLLSAVARQNDCGAYAYAEVICDQEREVLLKIGSDDDIFVWVNGQLVHKNIVARACAPDQDEVKVKLKAGVNRILCKILNGGGDWGFCVRVTDLDGNPLPLKQP
jgi:HEAT repeat protein